MIFLRFGSSSHKKANLCCSVMHSLHPYGIFHLGDSALTVDFGNLISDDTNKKVLQLFYRLQKCGLPCVKDLVPAYSSLTVYYNVVELKKLNPRQTAFDTMSDMINDAASGFGKVQEPISEIIEIPVCYSPQFALDVDVFENKGISRQELITIHTSGIYRVYMLGFLPGFAYMAEVDERIAMPRKERPRAHVAAGAVGIAGKQTGIYPLDSPGGWQIIGRTPVQLFDSTKERPVLFGPGERVKFYSISEDEFANYQSGHS